MPGRRKGHSEKRWAELAAEGSPLRRCRATTQAGPQCKHVAMAGSVMCEDHTSHLAEVQKLEREEWLMLAPKARREADRILDDPNASDTAKANVMKMINEAAGIREAHKVVVEVDTDPWMQIFGKDGAAMLEPMPRPVQPPPALPAIETGEVVRGEVVDPVQDVYDERVDPVPENVRPLNGWADIDQSPERKPSIFDAPANAEEARQKAKIPKRVRETFNDAS